MLTSKRGFGARLIESRQKVEKERDLRLLSYKIIAIRLVQARIIVEKGRVLRAPETSC